MTIRPEAPIGMLKGCFGGNIWDAPEDMRSCFRAKI